MKVIIINSKVHGRQEVFVDDDDYNNIIQYRWYVHNNNKNNTLYARTIIIIDKSKKKRVSMHSFIMKNDFNITRKVIDHIDGNGLNNKKINLRAVTHHQNLLNSKKYKKSKCKYKGIHVTTHIKKPYRSRIMYNGNRIQIGYFATQEEAALAYNKKAIELFGDYAKLNIIE